MVNTKDVIDVLREKFSKISPKTKSYIEFLPKDAVYPAFLYSIVFDRGQRESFLTSENKIIVKIEYLKGDVYDSSYCDDMFNIMNEAKKFLNNYVLKIQDRNLKFDYIINKTKEGNLSFIIIFKFKDTVIDENFEKEQKELPAQKVYLQ